MRFDRFNILNSALLSSTFRTFRLKITVFLFGIFLFFVFSKQRMIGVRGGGEGMRREMGDIWCKCGDLIFPSNCALLARTFSIYFAEK